MMLSFSKTVFTFDGLGTSEFLSKYFAVNIPYHSPKSRVGSVTVEGWSSIPQKESNEEALEMIQ